MKSVTVEQILAWHPCGDYTEERIRELFAGRDALTARDISVLDIPVEDRLWALLHPEFLSEKQARLFACDCAEQVVHLCGDDPRPQNAIDTARRYAHGEATDEELVAAWDAASAAASAAAWAAGSAAASAAAWDAAWDAASAAASAAAWAAGSAAAWDAALDAAWAAAWAAAWDAQLELLMRYIESDVP